ncbi:MAG: hypothetical protein EA368_17775 [Leptolyngbya sp. DLM2.Bin27]|nr:MAG: hypothetical protein EA368_17775 [Leptolyngbya sp. DLM2.Bin27]
MTLSSRQVWLNFLALLPATGLTVLTLAVAFLRFYDAQDFQFLQFVAQPRAWSNRLTVAALLVALVNLGVEWNRRNRETERLSRAEAERAEEEQRRAEEQERATRRSRIQNRWIVLQIQHQLDSSEQTRAAMRDFQLFLQEYGE